MRVIAGIYRSRPLAAPRGMATRPTSDRLRETLFDVIGLRVEGARFADLFAGSGAVGIEALSRGAAHVLFVEDNPAAADVIRRNLRSLGIQSGFTMNRRPLPAALHPRQSAATGREEGFDIVFLDPPYRAADDYESTLEALGRPGVLAAEGIVIVEHRRIRPVQGSSADRGALRTVYGCLRRYRVLKQGDAALGFYRPASAAEEEI